MRYLITILILLSFGASSAEFKKIMFTQSAIGDMKITKGMDISLYKLSKYFPFYNVTQSIGQGDSPDFHIFTVSTYENEELISFISYINEEQQYEKGVVKLDEVITCSDQIIDEFGISPKMHISRAITARDSLDFGAGHMDNYLGKGNLWYLFSVDKMHGTGVSKSMALKSNPRIDCISWPHVRWR
jgi:hypothetical protein